MPQSKKNDWEGIRAAYHGDEPVADICARHGISSRALYYHAKKRGWRLRTIPLSAEQLQKRKKYMVQSAYDVLEDKFRQMEEMLEVIDNHNLLEISRNAKTLHQLITSFKNLNALDTAIRDEGKTETGADNNDNPEPLRTELADRLKSLQPATD